MQLSKFITALAATALLAISATAQSSDTLATDNTSTEAVVSRSQMRNDRGLSNLKNNIVPKGQWVFGGSLTYSTHTNSDYSLLIVDGIDSKGYTVKVSPLVGYAQTFV